MKAGTRPRDFFEVDTELEEGIGRFREYRRRLRRGRVHLVVEVQGDVTVGHDVYADALTEGDVERVMREKPRRGQ